MFEVSVYMYIYFDSPYQAPNVILLLFSNPRAINSQPKYRTGSTILRSITREYYMHRIPAIL